MAATTSSRKILGVKLLTPEGIVFDETAEMVVAPGAAGEVGLLARHEPMVCSLRPGSVRIHQGNDQVHVFSTSEGYVSIGEDKVFILVEQAEELSNIDIERAEAALKRATQALEDAGHDAESLQVVKAAKARAENRLATAQRHGK